MNPEQPKQYTPKEIAEMEKSRTSTDTELLKGGAEYVVDEEGEKRLKMTSGQLEQLENIERFKETLKNIAGKEDDFEINILSMHKGKRSRKIGKLISFNDLEVILETTNAGLEGKDENEIILTEEAIKLKEKYGDKFISSWPTHSRWDTVIDLKVRLVSRD